MYLVFVGFVAANRATCFFLFLGMSLRHLDRWLSIIQKFARDLISVDMVPDYVKNVLVYGFDLKCGTPQALSLTYIPLISFGREANCVEFVANCN